MAETQEKLSAAGTHDVLGSGRAIRSTRAFEESSSDTIPALPVDFHPRKRPGRTDGITPRFENMLQEAQKTGFDAGYRAAFQALGLDARAVRVLRVINVREAVKVLGGLLPTDRVAILRRLEEMPPGDD